MSQTHVKYREFDGLEARGALRRDEHQTRINAGFLAAFSRSTNHATFSWIFDPQHVAMGAAAVCPWCLSRQGAKNAMDPSSRGVSLAELTTIGMEGQRNRARRPVAILLDRKLERTNGMTLIGLAVLVRNQEQRNVGRVLEVA